MNKFSLLVLALILTVLTLTLSQAVEGPYLLVRVTIDETINLNPLLELGLDVVSTVRGQSLEVVCFAEDLQQIQALGYLAEVVIPDLVGFYRERLQSANPMGPYHTWTECVAHLDSVHALYPNITTAKFSIGQTIEGREMWAIKVSDNPNLDENEPESFFNGLIHAREPITMEICLALLDRLTHDYGTDPQITNLVNGREIFIMPVFNVDGYVYNEQTAPGGGGMWRKNRRLNAGGSYGVDLNRNFAFNWAYNNIGSSPTPSSETYRGTAAFSEPECQNVRLFCNARHFAIALNIHAYGDLEEYPWMCPPPAWGYTPDNAAFVSLAQTMQQWTGYAQGPAWQVMYEMNGDASDWMYGEQTEKGKIMSFLFEVGSNAVGFWPPASEVPGLIAEMLPACLYLVDQTANFMPGFTVSLTPVNPPIVIPATGGSFNFNASVVRTSGPQLPFSVWARIRNPNGTYTPPTLGPVTINPPVGVTVTRLRTQTVPGSWSAGLYTYLGYANSTFTYPAVDSSSFNFTKSVSSNGGQWINEATCTGEPFPDEVVSSQPTAFNLIGAPNPFNASTALSYKLQATSHVRLTIWDATGRLVATLVDGQQSAGTHGATFDGTGLASGIYLARLQAGEFTVAQKLMLLK